MAIQVNHVFNFRVTTKIAIDGLRKLQNFVVNFKIKTILYNFNINIVDNNRITETSSICKKHFEDKYFVVNSKTHRLIPGAIPTIFVSNASNYVINI